MTDRVSNRTQNKEIKSILEPQHKTPIVYSTDILVVGGGIAGFAAALASARMDAEILLVERYGCLGGMVTGGLVTMFPKVSDGINGELLLRFEAGCALVYHKEFVATDPEIAKCILDEMLLERKVKLLFHSLAVGVVKDAGAIRGIIIEGKSGRQAIMAKMIIDATGDGDIAFLSGCPFKIGNEQGITFPVTLVTMLQNVGGRLSSDTAIRPDETGLRRGEWNCTLRGLSIDALNPQDLSRAETVLRGRMFNWLAQARKKAPGCKNAFMSQIASQIGVRETRRIIGVYTLRARDWKNKVNFEDSIGLTFENNKIPYRCLVPKMIRNLLVVGRCVSYDRDIIDPMRIVTSCVSTGQAGGVAAVLAYRSGVPIDKLDPVLLKKELTKQDVRL